MKVLITQNSRQGALFVANEIIKLLSVQKYSTLGLATGETQKPVYEFLVKSYREKKISFSGVTTFNLDEYVGLPAEHPSSYQTYMKVHLFSSVDLPEHQRHGLDGMSSNLQAEAARYESLLQSRGPIDLQLLGLGRNGHIGFNEPGSSFESRTRVEVLAETTRNDNKKHFQNVEDMPTKVLTMGIGNILEAKRILLFAFGKSKAHAVVKMIEGPMGPDLPASALQMHSDVLVVLDPEAAQELSPN